MSQTEGEFDRYEHLALWEYPYADVCAVFLYRKVIEIIYGRFFICGESDCEFASLPNDLIEKYLAMFEKPEIFIPLGSTIYVRTE